MWLSPALFRRYICFHQFSLRNESKLLTPIGKQVTVNGHRMNVSVKGEGPQTIVFLSGAGIASPILDFKNLSDPLSKNTRLLSWSEQDMVLVKIVIVQEM